MFHQRLISIPYLLLRGSTAGGAIVTGFVQTFVFARILTPERFSIFIVVGAIGYSLWLLDLGLAHILFVNLRASHLAGRRDEQAAHQATAVVLFYVVISAAASLGCFAAATIRFSQPPAGALELALFLLFVSLNLAWSALRSISIAVDLFIFYETVELTRRAAVIAAMLALLAGLPLVVFLVAANLLWLASFAAVAARLVAHGALARQWRGSIAGIAAFARANRRAIARSATGALSSAFTVTFPYYIVPLWFGLGAAPIVLEVTFRIFRGACVIFAAICDIAVPGQTRALAAHDAPRLVRTTLLAAGLCGIPAAIAAALLIFAGKPLFALLLRTAATVPDAITPVIVALLAAGVLQMVAETLLQSTGYFRSLAYTGGAVAVAMLIATPLAFIAGDGIVGFLAIYAAVYAAGAVAFGAAAVYGPIRAARARPA
jgi:O-antigen/teichoic acid export membrane protein